MTNMPQTKALWPINGQKKKGFLKEALFEIKLRIISP